MRITAASSRRLTALSLALTAGLGLAACSSAKSANPLNSSGGTGSVVVGSANFPENELLAEIYTLALEGKGVKVTDKFNISSRETYYPEIAKGAITIIPEYNGALLTTSVDKTSTAATTAQVDAALTAGLPSSLEILNPSSAQDKDSVTVTQAFAAQHHVTSIAQLKSLAGSMIMGGPPEFKTRTDGLVGLARSYGLHFRGFDPLDESGPITLAALQDGKVQAADVFTTTPQIITDHLVALADPKSNFAAQNVLPLVFKKGVNPLIVATLNDISAKLTTAGLLAMDKQIILDHASYATVATGWLRAAGLPY
ncbi:MAG TPA: ABC transporter substrate-binding protein [Streptosporangiaceae bacterium]|nr:ABC transporter substrate-binding protein [Streptosporangiaceae bacterium]